MKIPRRNLEKFVREIADECFISLPRRASQYSFFTNYFKYGSDEVSTAAQYNKVYAYIDDLESLLYSPVSLKFLISNPMIPNVLEEEKSRVAANHLRSLSRASDTDTRISDAVRWSLVKGKSFIKQTWKRGQFSSDLVMPEAFGVLNESHTKLDEDMEAFAHRMWITPYQFDRMIAAFPEADKKSLQKKAKKYISNQQDYSQGATKAVFTGGMSPFQAAGSNVATTRGMVQWMERLSPMLSPQMAAMMLPLDEVWIWDDARRDWATFQIIGDDILIMGRYFLANALAWNRDSGQEVSDLKAMHPFVEFSPNNIDETFWGSSEVQLVAMLQEGINARIRGINHVLRRQEDPPKKFIGATGVNQNALAKFNKPGGYWTDSNPNAKIEEMMPQLPSDFSGWLHELERMFDEMGGLPPIARGRGEAGVRSQGHAETLVRMFSPRFKDRALLIERSVATLGTLSLSLARAHCNDTMMAWVPEGEGGLESEKTDPFTPSPVKGQEMVKFKFNDLDDNSRVSVESHSASPAFQQEARALAFDLFKIGGADPVDVIDRVDVSDPEVLIAGFRRRQSAKAEAAAQEMKIKEAKAQGHGGHH